MTRPRITTTRVQLVIATLCLTTDTLQGALTAALVLLVLTARLLLIRQHLLGVAPMTSAQRVPTTVRTGRLLP